MGDTGSKDTQKGAALGRKIRPTWTGSKKAAGELRTTRRPQTGVDGRQLLTRLSVRATELNGRNNYWAAPWTGISPADPNPYPKKVEKFVLLRAIKKFPFDGRQNAMSVLPSLS